MAYNPAFYFPQTYQPQVFPAQMQGTQMSFANQQVMTPPTIHAEIVQVDGEQAAAAFPVGAGTSQMMIAKDDSAIYVKTANANGFTLDVFEKKQRTAQDNMFDPKQYIRKDELQTLVEAILAGKKEGAVNELV